MRYLHNNSIHSFRHSNGVPCNCIAGSESIRNMALFDENRHCSCGRYSNSNCSQFPPYPPPRPEIFPYTVNYYAGSVAPENILGTINGAGCLGEPIPADLTLFAPAGYQVPGTRSGANFISSMPMDNVVNVVYSPLLTI